MNSGKLRGYTFIELILVAAIIGILGAIAIPNFIEAKVRASAARSKADQALVMMAIEAYRVDHRSYPRNERAGESQARDLDVLTSPIAYLPFLPDDVLRRENRRFSRSSATAPRKFRYLNLAQVHSGEGMNLRGAPSPIGDGVVFALLWGDGPSQEASTFPPAGFMDDPDPGSKLGTSFVAYDPTNGTVSHGIIALRVP